MSRHRELLLPCIGVSNKLRAIAFVLLIFEFAAVPNEIQIQHSVSQCHMMDVCMYYVLAMPDVPYSWCHTTDAILRHTTLAIIGLRLLIFPYDGSHSDGFNRSTLGGQ